MSLWPDVLRFMIYLPLSLYKIVGQGLGQKPWKPTGTLTRGTLPAMTAGGRLGTNLVRIDAGT